MIEYRTDNCVSSEQFRQLLIDSGLAGRRPVDDPECVSGMLGNSSLIVSAWRDDLLVGIARSVTDFHYCCYLSDLAVHSGCRRMGIGIELQRRTQAALGPRCTIVLLAAPGASGYYPKIGYRSHAGCWTVGANDAIGA